MSDTQPTENNNCNNNSCGCPSEKLLHLSATAIKRTNAMVMKPKETWQEVKSESSSISEIYSKYLFLLAAVPTIASFIGLTLIGIQIPGLGTFRSPFFATLIHQLIAYAIMLAMPYGIACILEALAPKFGGQIDRTSAFKLVVFSIVPALAAGVFNIFPWLGALIGFVAGIYSIYLFWIGTSVMASVPAERKVGFVVVSAIAAIILAIVVGFIQTKLTPSIAAPPPQADMQELEEGMKKLLQKAMENSGK